MSEEAPKYDADRRQRMAERATEALYRGDAASQQLGMTIESCGPGRDRLDAHPPRHGERPPHLPRRPHLCARGQRFRLRLQFLRRQHRCSRRRDRVLAPAARATLRAIASERWRAGRAGIYEIEVCNQRDETVALFRVAATRLQGD
jgi:acyl-CoA thioesterase